MAVAKAYAPTPQERTAVDAYFSRKKDAIPCPQFKVSEGEDGLREVKMDHGDPSLGYVVLAQALGATDPVFVEQLVCQLSGSVPKSLSASEGLNFLLSVVNAIGPKNEIESLLAAQMAAVHAATMHAAARLSSATNLKQLDSAERALNKLARTFAAQLEALKRYRTGGERKVTVEHVHVHQGGQAIVGHVEQTVEGGGGKMQEQPHARTARDDYREA
jgi:hypothetical protein